MKEIEAFQLGKNEERLIELMQKLKYSHIDAKILTYMLRKGKASSKQIERDMDLRQPEVSTGLRRLRTQGIMGKTEIRKHKKGRPTHGYYLKLKPDAVKTHIIKYVDTQVAEMVSLLEEIELVLDKITKS